MTRTAVFQRPGAAGRPEAGGPAPRRSGGRRMRRGVLDGREWAHLALTAPGGLVFAPPLVGGGAAQQIRTLMPLSRSGLELFSFSYAGHGPDTGAFSLRTTLQDTRALLAAALETAAGAGLPAHGLGTCFGALPLVKAQELAGEPLDRLVLVNAMPRLPVLGFLASFWTHHSGRVPDGRWHPGRLRRSFTDFMERLFPGIAKTARGFGRLARSRVRFMETLVDLLTGGTLAGACLRKTPVLCIYTRNDRLIGRLWDLDSGGYEAEIRRICPKATFLPLGGDHFLSPGSNRRKAIGAVADFLAGPAARPLPAAGAPRPVSIPFRGGRRIPVASA